MKYMKEQYRNNKVIRILHIGMHDKIGGVETYIMNYYRNIDKNRFQFDFISSFPRLCFEDEINELGGKVYHVISEKKNPIKYYKSLAKIMKNYDIVHINMLSSANVLPVMAAKKARVKNVIVHSHNANTPNGLLRKFLDHENRNYLRNNSTVTNYWACSKKAGLWMFGKEICESESFSIIPNAVDASKFKFDQACRNEIRNKYNLNEKFVIGHVGRFSYQKNHEFLIEMFYRFQKENENAILMLIGDGELKEDILDTVNRMNINNKVIFVGNTNVVYKYLNAFDVFVLPSRFEGLPVVGVEAQMVGVPCLFSKEITTEVDIRGNSVFLDLNYEQWLNALTKLYNKLGDETKVKTKNDLKDYNIKNAVKNLENKYLALTDFDESMEGYDVH